MINSLNLRLRFAKLCNSIVQKVRLHALATQLTRMLGFYTYSKPISLLLCAQKERCKETFYACKTSL